MLSMEHGVGTRSWNTGRTRGQTGRSRPETRQSWPSLPLLAVLFRRKRRVAHSLEVIWGEAELGQYVLMGNGLVVLQPFARLGRPVFFLRADLLILKRGVSESSGYRIEHGLQQPRTALSCS